MKKMLILFFTAVFVFSTATAFGSSCHGDKKAGHAGMHAGEKYYAECAGLFHMQGVEYKLQDTKAGVKILVFSGDEKVSEKIKEKAEKWFELRKKNRVMKNDNTGNTVKCPVMGTEMKKSEAYSSMKYKGKTYYFCCAGCPENFKKDPEKYIE